MCASCVVVDSGAALGAWAGGRTAGVDVVDVAVPEPREEPERPLDAAFAVVLLPGKALAATSESRAVSATLPAISQRLARASRRMAASLSMRLCWTVMQRVCAGQLRD